MEQHRPSPVVWTIPGVFAILYALWPILEWPRPFYAPETRQIFWSRLEGVTLMGWYGRVIMASVSGILIGGVLGWWARRLPVSWQRKGPWLTAAAVGASMTIVAVYEARRWIL